MRNGKELIHLSYKDGYALTFFNLGNDDVFGLYSLLIAQNSLLVYK